MEVVFIIAGLMVGGLFGAYIVDDKKVGAELEVLAWSLTGLILFVGMAGVLNLI
ncbi:MAG: hypothetical protein HOM88_03625 [Hellea sp.]|nr:hypothetical protein [Hellea sp.]